MSTQLSLVQTDQPFQLGEFHLHVHCFLENTTVLVPRAADFTNLLIAVLPGSID